MSKFQKTFKQKLQDKKIKIQIKSFFKLEIIYYLNNNYLNNYSKLI